MRYLMTVLLVLMLAVTGVVAQEDAEEAMMMQTLWASVNAAGLETDGVSEIASDLSEVLATTVGFEEIVSVESVAFSVIGDAYLTVDYSVDADNAPTAGGLMVIEGFAAAGMADGMASEMGSRLIVGESTGLLTPKGLHVIDELGVVLVADTGARKVYVWPLDAEGGDTAPWLVLNGGDERALWDIWYDRGNDILYGAGTDGVAVAYDLFSETLLAATEMEMGDGEMMEEIVPTRAITPTDANGNQISVNLHGVDVDYDNNLLILTDVGDAASNEDGQIFTIEVASLADGPTEVTARIFGAETRLGNPVDVIFDSMTGGIYVAEKANDLLLFYADINGLFGDLDMAADTALEFVKPESVDIYPPRPFMMSEM